MRKNKIGKQHNDIRILALDDDETITLALKAYFESSGYEVDVENDPREAIDRIRRKHYDILLLDFLMAPMCGDEVVSKIREFDRDLYIVLLTGHKDLAPPLQTIRELEIQGYYEKSDRFDQLELLVESCVKSIHQMQTIKRNRDGLNRVLMACPEIHQPKSVLDTVVRVTEQLSMLSGEQDCFAVAYRKQENGQTETCYAGQGCFERGEPEYHADWLPRHREALEQAKERVVHTDTEVLIPLLNEDKERIGILAIQTNKRMEEDLLRMLMLYAKQAGAAIANAWLHDILSDKNEELSDTYTKLRESYIDTVKALRLMVDAKDIYTRGHSDRVSYYGVYIAKAMGFDDKHIERIRIAGLFHDVGKIGVSDLVLQKAGPLTEQEYAHIQEHSAVGYNIVSAISHFKEVAEIIRGHHERYDGKGYPDHKKGEENPIEARIICVADAFDAMTSDRHYRKHLSLEDAMAQLRAGRGTQFDARVVDVFLDILGDFDRMKQEISWTFDRERPESQAERGAQPNEEKLPAE